MTESWNEKTYAFSSPRQKQVSITETELLTEIQTTACITCSASSLERKESKKNDTWICIRELVSHTTNTNTIL